MGFTKADPGTKSGWKKGESRMKEKTKTKPKIRKI